MKETGLPDKETQRVKGSSPTCSEVAPRVSVTGPGTVTGIGEVQTFPVALTVTPVISSVTVSIVQLKFGKQESFVYRARKDAAKSSCFSVRIGQTTSRVNSWVIVSTHASNRDSCSVTPLIS